MSEFSESYHLRGATQQDGIALLERAGLRGYVLPAAGGWVTFVADDANFIPRPALVRDSGFPVVHYANAEDHGWSFSVFDAAGRRVSRYAASWEAFEVEVVADQLDVDAAVQVLGLPASVADDILPWLATRDLDEVVDRDGRDPGHHVAAALGLPAFAWLAYRYLALDEARTGRAPDGVIRVGDLPEFPLL